MNMFTTKSLSKIFLVVILVIYSITAFWVRNGLSQEVYPNRPITIVVPWGPGMFDSILRILSRAAEKELGQPIVVENRPGATSVVGTNHVFKSTPDGYTLVYISSHAYAQNPHIMNVPYDVFKDTTDVCGIFKHSHSFAVKEDAPWKTFEEVITYAKKNPGKFKYACSGKGGSQHIAFEYIGTKEGIKWTMVPFGSGGEATMAALGGHTDGVVAGSFDFIPFVRAGKMRILLGLNDFRLPDFPDIPHMLEKGYTGFASTITGVAGPKGIPEPVIQKLENAFKKAVKDPSFMEAARNGAFFVNFMTGKEYTESWKSRYDLMGELIKAMGLTKK
jgi:tripartite-type tricarboxylate transporter receptor subunit TctC